MSEKRFQCNECTKTFKDLKDLLEHNLENIHESNDGSDDRPEGTIDDVIPTSKLVSLDTLKTRNKKGGIIKRYNFSCDICNKNFTYRKHLTFHKKSHGIVSDALPQPDKKCPLCDFKDPSKNNLCEHFQNEHNITVSFKKLTFSGKEEFKKWKAHVEESTNTRYVKDCGDKSFGMRLRQSFVCHRSGYYVPQGENKRRLKFQGSKKIGGFCPAMIRAFVDIRGHFRVYYTKTHVGHEADAVHLNLSNKEKEEIARKIAFNTSFDQIIDEMKNDASCDSSKRISLLTKKDLWNIATHYNGFIEQLKTRTNGIQEDNSKENDSHNDINNDQKDEINDDSSYEGDES